MRSCLFYLLFLTACSALLLTVGTGCHREEAPPEPLALEQIPAELQKGFSKASAELKAGADQVVAAVQNKDYPAAFQAIQALSSNSGLTKPQGVLLSRTLLTINGLLQTAQSQGDEKATTVLKEYQSSK